MMKILIVGAGRAGLEVAIQLSRIGHAVTIIDTDPAVARRAAEQFGLVALPGDAACRSACIGFRLVLLFANVATNGDEALKSSALLPPGGMADSEPAHACP